MDRTGGSTTPPSWFRKPCNPFLMEKYLDILIPIIFFGSVILNQFFGKKKGEAEDTSTPPIGTPADEQFRKIREEIQRRIREQAAKNNAENGGNPAQPPPGLPPRMPEQQTLRPIVLGQDRSSQPQRTMSVPVERRENPMDALRKKTLLLQQQAKEAQLKAQSVLQKTAQKANSHSKLFQTVATHAGVRGIRADLRNPDVLRRMVVASEILGKPVSLRKSGSWNN
jgi:hypothetical protein